jgi:GNAT superfamily N-acetyltransferase/NTP pyrophosphatase (non-canonical NTP hydrolase)
MSSLQKLIALERATAKLGFDWPNVESIIDQAISECDEIRQTIRHNEGTTRLLEEVGDLIHACISLCVFQNLNINEALVQSTNKFSSRLDALQQIMEERGLQTLQGQSFDFLLELWHEAKIRTKAFKPLPLATIRMMQDDDITTIVDSFAGWGWQKPAHIFQGYLQEQRENMRMVWVAFVGHTFAGYVTLRWQSSYKPFQEKEIPEINDLNVVPSFQGKRIGSQLLDKAEEVAKDRSAIVGLGVGLSADYGKAQQVYVNRGYVPDGRGITYRNEPLKFGSSVMLDDDLVLWLTKKFS